MKKYYELNEEEYNELVEKIKTRCNGVDPVAYCINNITALVGMPLIIGSALADVIYWMQNKSDAFDSAIIAYYCNDVFYQNLEEKDKLKVFNLFVDSVVPIPQIRKKYKEVIEHKYGRLFKETLKMRS